MSPILILAIFSTLAVAFGILLATHAFSRARDRGHMILLGLLFLSISMRIAKSIFYYMTGIPDAGVALGLVGLASIGPLLWLYLRAELRGQLVDRLDWLHFSPSIIGGVGIWLSGDPFATYTYQTTTVILLGYLISTGMMVYENKDRITRWQMIVYSMVLVVWGAFVYQHLSNTILDYAIGAAVASICFYAVFILVLVQPKKMIKSQNKEPRISQAVLLEVRKMIEEEKIYKQPSLTLAKLAEKMNQPSYVVSQALRRIYGKAFPELINSYRIQDVKSKLVSEESEFVKIEGLAYEVGFNTPSAFYAAFKKETSLSPREFRKQQLSA